MIAAIVAPLDLAFSLITTEIEKTVDALEAGGAIVAVVYNDAQSKEGTYYWPIVNNGRGPVRPIRAKALHWVDAKTGADVFSKYSKAVAPRHIRENSIPSIQQALVKIPGGKLERETIAQFVNEVAAIAVEELKSRTPVVTGKLRDSYRIEKGEA